MPKHQAHTFKLRLAPDLSPRVQRWLELNPGNDRETLIDAALRAFLNQPQAVEPVQVVTASVDEMVRAFEQESAAYAYTMERLK